jgi:hypothetical protein
MSYFLKKHSIPAGEDSKVKARYRVTNWRDYDQFSLLRFDGLADISGSYLRILDVHQDSNMPFDLLADPFDLAEHRARLVMVSMNHIEATNIVGGVAGAL